MLLQQPQDFLRRGTGQCSSGSNGAGRAQCSSIQVLKHTAGTGQPTAVATGMQAPRSAAAGQTEAGRQAGRHGKGACAQTGPPVLSTDGSSTGTKCGLRSASSASSWSAGSRLLGTSRSSRGSTCSVAHSKLKTLKPLRCCTLILPAAYCADRLSTKCNLWPPRPWWEQHKA